MRRFNGYFSDKRKQKFVDNSKTNNHIAVLCMLRQHLSVRIVAECACKAGLILQGFKSDENLELYYDVYHQRRRLCYLSKGWCDPGFRIGEQIDIDRKIPDFKNKFNLIYDIAFRNLISVGVFDVDVAKVSLFFQIGLYKDGFNSLVFREAVDVLDESLGEVRKLLNLALNSGAL